MTNTVDLLATASRFAIAAAIVYFAYQLAQINDKVEVVTQSIDQVSQHIEPTLEEAKAIRLEIAEARKLVPRILDEVAEVRKQLPPVVVEIAEVRKQIPPILAQVDAINNQIDPILKRVDKSFAVIDDTNRQIPQIIKSTDNAVAALNQTREQIAPLVPLTLEEIRLSREKIDPTLDRVDDLVEDAYFKAQETITSAQAAGQQASEGAVKGFFTGIIKLPFELVGTLASPILKNIDKDVAKQLTEKDVDLMGDAGKRVAESGKIGKVQRWENPKSGNSGSITLIRKFKIDDTACVEARITISNRRKEILDKLESYCRGDDDQWILATEIKRKN